MWKVDEKRFFYVLQQFTDSVIEKQNEYDYQTSAIAFHTGYLFDREWYKRLVWDKARESLNAENWTENMVGRGQILSAVLTTMNKKINGQKNNMLNWRNAAFMQAQFRDHPAESEGVIYQIFKGNDEEAAFNAAMELWGATYPVITYLFFLKSRSRFVPMRPQLMEERLKFLGFETECCSTCSWENYLEYLDLLKWIQGQLMIYLDDSAEFIDAHSFVWMMEMVDDIAPDPEMKDLLEHDIFDSVVITGRRGSRTREYYVSRYEKDPRIREAAILAHGYQCMACGFNFEQVYGTLGRNYIEVHQIRPLHSREEEITIDPEKDLVCLCANCHRMIHRSKNSIMSIAELKQWILWGPIWQQSHEK